MTFEEFVNINNEDEKASIVTLIKERKGNKGLLDFLGADLVDSCILKHDNGYIETINLYKTINKYPWANDSKGNQNVQLAWNEMTCPSTGNIYLIETCPMFTSALDSAKWLRPAQVPIDLIYKWQSAN